MGTFWRGILKGAIGPRDNDSWYLLDVRSRDLPDEATMRRYAETDEVDLVIVGAGAGGSVLAQRLARRGWRVVIIEAIDYEQLRPHYEQVEAELPVAGQDWPWGYPHRYPFSPHPVSGPAAKLREGALRCGIELRVGPVPAGCSVAQPRVHARSAGISSAASAKASSAGVSSLRRRAGILARTFSMAARRCSFIVWMSC
jgi:NAD(P)-dependent dehydrogenase (short-subunit alcohol dehydrogenase family)